MKTRIITTVLLALLLFLNETKSQENRLYFSVEIDEVLCGYATTDTAAIVYNGMALTETHDTVRLQLRALEKSVDMQIISRHIINPHNEKVVLNATRLINESGISMDVSNEVHDGYVIRHDHAAGSIDTVIVDRDVIFANPLTSLYLVRDFSGTRPVEKTYYVYDFMRGIVGEHTLSFLGEEDLVLAGKPHASMLFDDYSRNDGLRTRKWIRKEDGLELKIEVLNRVISLDDHTVPGRINTVDLKNSIFGKVDEKIPDFKDLTYMKVAAELRSGGESLTAKSLNFPGQRFEGTVIDNHIKGVFEMAPVRFDPSSAPPFPPVFETGEVPAKYLEPEVLIESDHPEIIAKAAAITAGSADSWDAAVRLSTWVGTEIKGAVPGGTSAINTLRTRQGECGSHSRLLVAFCRASGIPSRLAIGCMYSPWYGGSFGQHAWTEVYMGSEAGWVAVDATIEEFDYVDAGHIRLGERTSFMPEQMEILEYTLGNKTETLQADKIPQQYRAITGHYVNAANGDVLEVQYRDKGIIVDVKGKMVLKLKEADADGRMYTELTDNAYFSFKGDTMLIVEKVYAMKNISELVDIEYGTPGYVQAIVGSYLIFQVQKEFRFSWGKGQAYVLLPDSQSPRPLEYQAEEGYWRDPQDEKEYRFSFNEDGSAKGVEITSYSRLYKKNN